MKKIISIALILIQTFSGAALASVSYLPDVTAEMSEVSYWTQDDTLLMSYDEITEQNRRNISTHGTAMYDLKNQAETVNTVSLNKSLLSSTRSDTRYYTGWTYVNSTRLATAEDYAHMVWNTQNPNPSVNQPMRYGVAVRTSAIRSFPSFLPIWDDPVDKELDYQYLSALRVNEPVAIMSESADGMFYLVRSICCSGWVPSADIAVCRDKAEWLRAWDIPPEETLVVWGDRVYTEYSVTGSSTSLLLLTMGTTLRLSADTDPNALVDNRASYQNYVVYIPVRNEDGSYAAKLTLIPEKENVNPGYLPLTQRNIGMVALTALGNTYGWGGGLNSDDCSGYIRSIYKCFGLELARNTVWQEKLPVTKVDMKGMTHSKRLEVMDSLPFGAVLFFNGHEMMYLGKSGGKHFVISAVGSIMEPFEGKKGQRIRSTVINSLDTKRASGVSWLDDLTCANVPYSTDPLWEIEAQLRPGVYSGSAAVWRKN